LPAKQKVVGWYLRQLKQSKKEKPQQIREALEIYIGLWENLLAKNLVGPEDSMDDALRKIDARGGLIKAAEE